MEERFLKMAIDLAKHGVRQGGGPFGAVLVFNGEMVSSGFNSVTINNDPTAHAEIMAIRSACRRLKRFKLDGFELYSSCEPCPMCLSAIYWAGISKVYYAATRQDAAKAGFDDDFIYREIDLSPEQRHIPTLIQKSPDSLEPFSMWILKEDKTRY